MSIVIIILACILTILTYQYIRQRIVDKKNEELNRKVNDACTVKHRKVVFSDTLPSLQWETLVLRYIGNIEEYQGTPHNGYFGIYEDYVYVFTESDGIWHKHPEAICPKIELKLKTTKD